MIFWICFGDKTIRNLWSWKMECLSKTVSLRAVYSSNQRNSAAAEDSTVKTKCQYFYACSVAWITGKSCENILKNETLYWSLHCDDGRARSAVRLHKHEFTARNGVASYLSFFFYYPFVMSPVTNIEYEKLLQQQDKRNVADHIYVAEYTRLT